jgi:hypothetical protein
MMKKLVFLLIVILAVSMMALTASANPPQEAVGVWSYLPQALDIYKVVGGNQFMTFSELGMWTGTFSGAAYESGSGMIHSNGTWTFKLTAWLDEATVNGETGSLEIRAMGSRAAGEENWTGTWHIEGGSLHDDGLRGQGTFDGPGFQGDPAVWGEIPYEGTFHFESH